MKTLSATLITAQSAGYPTGGVKPYIYCVFTSGATTYDYTFNPTLTTNRMLRIEHHDELWDEWATIILRNQDLAVPDLRGYYVDLKYGANTSTGNEVPTESCGRMWVISQHEVSAPGILQVELRLVGKMRILQMQRTLIRAGRKREIR